jgi:hypothetical protein
VTGLAQGAELRTAMFEEREHVVVPVIALLGDVVVRPLGSSGPEFVPAEELAIAPGGWNGRPVVPDHPSSGSANEPRTLEAQAFGRLFGSRFEDGKLKTEAWLDPMRAAKVGSDAKRVIERCRAGEQVEVSVGAWVIAEKQEGTAPDGTPYEFRWHSITPDHLAMLPEGAIGACDISMGCGAPRAAKGVAMAVLQKVELDIEVKDRRRSLRERMRSLFGGDALDFLRFRGAESMSDGDLRHSLDAALFAEEPGFLGIDQVFPDDSLVIYAVAPEQAVTLFRRSFTVDEDGAISLAAEKEAVEPVTRYEPVKAEAEPVQATTAVARAACSCNDKGENAAQGDEMKKTDLVGRLIANERSPFTDSDSATLAALSETALAALDETYKEPEPAAKTEEPKEEQPKPVADPQAVTLSREEYEDMRAAATNFRAQQTQRKGALVAKLKGAQSAYTEQELQAMSLDQLEKTTQLLRLDVPALDYSLRGEPGFTAASGEDPIYRNPPDGYDLAGTRKRGQNGKEAN